MNQLRRGCTVTREEAEARTVTVREKFGNIRAGWWTLGLEVRACLEDGVPAALEMTAHEWMTACFDDSVAKLYRARRIAEQLEGMPPERLAQLSEGAAYEMARLPTGVRELAFEKAITLSNSGFKAWVDGQLAEKGMPAEEKFVQFRMSWPASLVPLAVEAEKKVASVLELDIETRPGLKATCWEAVLAWVNNTPEERLRVELVGGEGP